MIGVLIGMFTCGCQDPLPNGPLVRTAPPDFAIVFAVEPADPASPTRGAEAGSSVATRPAIYILEPDRTLRVAIGPGAAEPRYPGTTAILAPAQRDELYRLIADAGLLRRPLHGEPEADSASGEPIYRVAITASGQTVRHRRRAADAGALTGLLHRLADLAGLEESPQAGPARGADDTGTWNP